MLQKKVVMCRKQCYAGGMKTMHALMVSLLSAALVACDAGNGKVDEVAATLPEKADLLASNTVVAKYLQTVEQPCRFMTALCPDRCDHATRLAQFEVLANEHYEHPGKYGDEKMEPGSVAMVDVKKEVLGQSPEVAKIISGLHPGDKVRLTIRHYYVQQGQGQFPVRPVVSLQKM